MSVRVATSGANTNIIGRPRVTRQVFFAHVRWESELEVWIWGNFGFDAGHVPSWSWWCLYMFDFLAKLQPDGKWKKVAVSLMIGRQ